MLFCGLLNFVPNESGKIVDRAFRVLNPTTVLPAKSDDTCSDTGFFQWGEGGGRDPGPTTRKPSGQRFFF